MSKRAIETAKCFLRCAVMYISITLIAAAPTAFVAAWLLPEVARRRGQFAVGGEWLLLGCLFVALFNIINKIVLHKLFGEEE